MHLTLIRKVHYFSYLLLIRLRLTSWIINGSAVRKQRRKKETNEIRQSVALNKILNKD